MHNFFRLLSYLRRHWQLFSAGMLVMIVTTLFGGASLTMIYPIFKQLFDQPAGTVVTVTEYDDRPLLTQIGEACKNSRLEGNLLNKPDRDIWTKKLEMNFNGLLLHNSPRKILSFTCILVLITILIKSATFYLYHFIFGVLQERFSKEMRDDLFAKVNTHSLHFFDKFRTGDLISRMISDIEFLKRVVVENVAETFYDLGQITVYLGIALLINWKLTLFVVLMAPPFALILDFIARKLKKYSYKSQVEAAGMTNVLEESITSMKVILAYVKHKFIEEKFSDETMKFYRSRKKMVKYNTMNRPVSEFVSVTLGVVIFWFAGNMMMKGDSNLDFAAFMLFMGALYSTFQPMRTLARIYNDLQKGLGVAVRYFEIYDLEPEIIVPLDAKVFEGLTNELRLENVTFSYDGKKQALKNIDLTIKRGEIIALVGPSGGGKTSITNLLTRFYDPQQGTILYDGVDLRNIELASLRHHIGIVTQDTILFHDTVFNNIAFGRPECEPEKVYKAAKTANAHDFILKLPEGYQTIIGERGSRLSGGQKQRLAIARAVLNDPEIIIFDEATSALDSEAEMMIQQAMENVVKGRTVILIAHRLSTIRHADRILVIEKGEITEEGIHEDLMSADGQYRHLHDLQYLEGNEGVIPGGPDNHE